MVCFRYIIVNTLHTGGCGGDGDGNNNIHRTKMYAKGQTALPISFSNSSSFGCIV
jgi:hypothetical protein